MRTFDHASKISKYFTYHEALWLPQWARLANESDGLNDEVLDALEFFFLMSMDYVRDAIGAPINVHCGYRPLAYNKLIGGAAASCHMARKDPGYGLVAACDWDALPAMNCDRAREILFPQLEALAVRMEDNGEGTTWVHCDNRAQGPAGRFFKP